MSTLVILTHPNMTRSQVNRKWRDALLDDGIDVHELYHTYPDGVIDVKAEQSLLERYDTIIFQYPMYWYSSPSLLKQYLDEVFLYGWAYGSTGNALKGKQFGLAVSIGGEADHYNSETHTRYTPETLLTPMLATFDFIGAKYIGLHKLHGAANIDSEQLKTNTAEYLSFIHNAK
ncbi:NAD(P)H-dependent oxidoreductase [Staphylococcus sp. 17KM0847]|uniref:NAD(P)H-dependent oxidoreductase n=1 Tax=Staphylococcus sp. 17KM0847 TaxID=2583989 RepID=UPI0015DC9E0B|nr:NAD(P)H-dependent oxidoreductase [Staphylococcus sp. 17KM0847]QLK86193.1 NAD(P)H-dependent oxidoreductase [Staphylococcus sp. 17KM0847]